MQPWEGPWNTPEGQAELAAALEKEAAKYGERWPAFRAEWEVRATRIPGRTFEALAWFVLIEMPRQAAAEREARLAREAAHRERKLAQQRWADHRRRRTARARWQRWTNEYTDEWLRQRADGPGDDAIVHFAPGEWLQFEAGAKSGWSRVVDPITKTCPECGNQFTPKRVHAITCSPVACWPGWRREPDCPPRRSASTGRWQPPSLLLPLGGA